MTDYSYTEELNKEQWAWEFLRRNPEYQRDYTAFMHRWRALEADYGKSEDRDVERWQSDLRSLANEWATELTLLEEFPDGEDENASQETVQIENWISNKWGFSSFPLDPKIHSPKTPDELTWSEQKINLDDIRFDAQTSDPIAQVNFDLRYSLTDQLDAAHKDLITLTGQLQRLGKVKLVAADHFPQWLEQLKLLDDTQLFEESSEEQQLTVKQMCESAYKNILLMRG